MKSNSPAERIAKLAMMTAISLVLIFLIRIPFPPAPFLVYDPADIPIYITSFAYGPLSGLAVTLVTCLIQAFMLGGDGLYGFIMHFFATGITAFVIGALYRKCKTKRRAIIALATGIVVCVLVMCVVNLLITPYYMGVDIKAVAAMIPTIILPFNLLKIGINSLLTFLLYKRVSKLLK